MSTSDATPPSQQQPSGTHAERLYVAWWGWLLPLAAGVLLAAAVHRGYSSVPTWLPYTIAVVAAVGLIVRMSATPVRITGDGTDRELQVAGARLPARHAGTVTVIAKRGKQAAMGPQLDPRAYVVHRAWVPAMVRVHVDDPADPTPYWLFSTRHPQRIVQLLHPTSDGSSTTRHQSQRKR